MALALGGGDRGGTDVGGIRDPAVVAQGLFPACLAEDPPVVASTGYGVGDGQERVPSRLQPLGC